MIPDWSDKGKGTFTTGVSACGTDDHTILMALRWTSPWEGQRQWVLNFGQQGRGAEHWLWNGGDKIQFGMWSGRQISDAPMEGSSVLATVKEGGVYRMYLDGGLQLSTLEPQRSTLNPQPSTRNPRPSTLNPQPTARNPRPATLDPQPATHSPQPSTRNPQPSTLNPQPVQVSWWGCSTRVSLFLEPCNLSPEP